MSQCSRVLEVLRDHKPHSIQEIHERAGTMRLNSRVSDLRRFGFNIAYYRLDGLHTYQLLPGTVREGYQAAVPAAGIPRGPLLEAAVPTSDGPGAKNGDSPACPARQLRIWEAAA